MTYPPPNKAWLDANIGTYQDTALTTPATANNTLVRGWKDQSGNTADFVATNGPTLKTNAQNGLSALDFTPAAASYLLNSTLGGLFQGTQSFTIAIAGVQRTVTASPGQEVASWATAASSEDYGYCNFRNPNASPSGPTMSRTNAGPEVTDLVDPGANPLVAMWRYDASVVKTQTFNDVGTAFSSGDNGSTINQMALGAIVRAGHTTGQFFLDGQLYEVMIWDTALSDADAALVVSYLETKLGTSFTFAPVLTPTAYHGGVNLTWPNTMPNVTNFRVQSSPDGVAAWTTAAEPYVSRLFDGSATTKTYYRAAVLNGANVGPYSAVVNATPGGANTIANTAPALFIGDFPGLGLADNAAVNTYTDTSSAGNNLDGTGHAPVNKVNIQNGLAMGLATIAGVDYWIGDAIGAALAGTNVPRCVFIVLKHTSIAVQQCPWILYDISNGGLSTHDYLLHPDIGQWELNNRGQDGLVELMLNAGTIDTDCHIHCCDYNGSDFTLYVDGFAYPSGSGAGSTIQNFDEFTVGAHRKGNIDQPLDGYVGDVVVFNGGLGSANVSNVFALLRGKWGTPAGPGNAIGGRMVCTYIPMNR